MFCGQNLLQILAYFLEIRTYSVQSLTVISNMNKKLKNYRHGNIETMIRLIILVISEKVMGNEEITVISEMKYIKIY